MAGGAASAIAGSVRKNTSTAAGRNPFANSSLGRAAGLGIQAGRDKRAADHEHAPSQGAQAMQAAGNPAGAAGSGAMMSPGMAASGIDGGLAAAEDRQTTSQAMGNNFISKPQQAMGQDMFGGQSIPQKGMIGVAGMEQNPLMMSDKQEKAFGPGSEVYESGNTAIYKGLK